MRVTLKTDYALRAMAHLAAAGDAGPVKADEIAHGQSIPLKFLLTILGELKLAHLIRSQRGPDGGFLLRRSPHDITLADVIRAVDGPLANVHDTSLEDLRYAGPAESLRDVWMAVRTSLRSVLESTTLADLTSGSLPDDVRRQAAAYQEWMATNAR
jgi:Rrf2 family protein